MGVKLSRKLWLWPLAVVLFGSAPAFSACEGPTVNGSNIRGRVHAIGSHEIPGATVRLLNGSGKEVAQAQAGPDGRFSISAPERGRYRLTVTAEGFLEVSAVVVVKKLGKDSPILRVDLGSDATRPCGGGGVTVPTAGTLPIGR